jgi:hypothetical protein
MYKPKQLSDWSDEEKCKKFNEFYMYALDNFDFILCNQTELKDCDHFAYEMIMDLLGEGVWGEINKLL